jgi:hypothetical protein
MEERVGFPFSGLVLLVCAVSLAALCVTSRAQTRERDGERKVSDEAAGQIRSMLDEKETRTPAQKKIDSQLLYALKQKRGDLRGVPSAPIDLKLDEKGRALVDINARVSPQLLSKIRRLGGVVVSKFETYHTIRARIALDRLEALAGRPDVVFIRPAAEAVTDGGAMTN